MVTNELDLLGLNYSALSLARNPRHKNVSKKTS